MNSSTGNPIRTRQDRVSKMQLPPGETEKFLATCKRPEVLIRVGLCAVVATFMWTMTRGWESPLRYRTRQVPVRDLVARADFSVEDPAETEKARDRARRSIECVYTNEPKALEQLVFALGNKVGQITSADSLEDLENPNVLYEFFPTNLPNAEGKASQVVDPAEQASQRQKFFKDLKAYMAEQDFKSSELYMQLTEFVELKRNGLLESLAHEIEQGDQDKITVQLGGEDTAMIPNVPVTHVLLSNAKDELLEKLESIDGMDIALTRPIHFWIARQLKPTLTFDRAATAEVAEAAAAAVPTEYVEYKANRDHLALAGKPLGSAEFDLLRRENEAANAAALWTSTLARGASAYGMYLALYTLGGLYIIRKAARSD